MPKSTPNPTNRTANAIDSRLSEPTIIRPTAVVMERPIKRLTNTAKMIFGECSAIQRMNSTTDMVPIPLTTAPSATVENSSSAIGTGPVSLTPRAIFTREIEIAGGLPDGIGRVLARLQRIEIEDRFELDEGTAIGVGQGLVADEFAPGECRRTRVQHVLDRLGDQRERPRSAIKLDFPALDAGKSGFQRAGQSPQTGVAGHDFNQRGCGCELAGQPTDLRGRKKQQPVLFEEFAGPERLNRIEMLGIAG